MIQKALALYRIDSEGLDLYHIDFCCKGINIYNCKGTAWKKDQKLHLQYAEYCFSKYFNCIKIVVLLDDIVLNSYNYPPQSACLLNSINLQLNRKRHTESPDVQHEGVIGFRADRCQLSLHSCHSRQSELLLFWHMCDVSEKKKCNSS